MTTASIIWHPQGPGWSSHGMKPADPDSLEAVIGQTTFQIETSRRLRDGYRVVETFHLHVEGAVDYDDTFPTLAAAKAEADTIAERIS